MSMKGSSAIAIAVVLSGAAAVPGRAAAPAPEDEQARRHALWREAMTPGAAHSRLAEQAGTWDVTIQNWMDPEQPPLTRRGTSTFAMILGGRYLEEVFHGELLGQSFEGHGLTGYDNVLKKYVSTWVDSASTGIASTLGTCAADGRTCTASGEVANPATGKASRFRVVTRVEDRDRRTLEMWTTSPEGKEYKNMELRYVRR